VHSTELAPCPRPLSTASGDPRTARTPCPPPCGGAALRRGPRAEGGAAERRAYRRRSTLRTPRTNNVLNSAPGGPVPHTARAGTQAPAGRRTLRRPLVGPVRRMLGPVGRPGRVLAVAARPARTAAGAGAGAGQCKSRRRPCRRRSVHAVRVSRSKLDNERWGKSVAKIDRRASQGAVRASQRVTGGELCACADAVGRRDATGPSASAGPCMGPPK
jgi:hypothetical protein